MSRPTSAVRRTAALVGLATACLVPFLASSPASAGGAGVVVSPPAPVTTAPVTVPVTVPTKPPTIAGFLAPYAAGFDIDNNDFNVATHLVLQFPDLVAASARAGTSTVFLPTDYAFRRLVKALTGATVVNEAKLFATVMLLGRDRVGQILRHHIVVGARVTYRTLATVNGRILRTLQGGRLTVHLTTLWRRFVWLADAASSLTDAKVIRADVNLSNGVVHVIDQVMLPFAP